jgi:hypothetical protein
MSWYFLRLRTLWQCLSLQNGRMLDPIAMIEERRYTRGRELGEELMHDGSRSTGTRREGCVRNEPVELWRGTQRVVVLAIDLNRALVCAVGTRPACERSCARLRSNCSAPTRLCQPVMLMTQQACSSLRSETCLHTNTKVLPQRASA